MEKSQKSIKIVGEKTTVTANISLLLSFLTEHGNRVNWIRLFISAKIKLHFGPSQPHYSQICMMIFMIQTEAKEYLKNILVNVRILFFLFVLYLDDGSLSITKSINHRLKRIYLTPHIFLYLQSFNQEDLILLQQHINQHFQLNFSISKRKDGFGYILRFTSTSNTYKFLDKLSKYASEIPEMYYKTNWSFRLAKETKLLKQSYPGYKVIASSSHRNKAYSYEEIQKLIELKKLGVTDKQISITLNRTYWSVVYKLRELRKQNLL